MGGPASAMGGCSGHEERPDKFTDNSFWFAKDEAGTKDVDCFYIHPTTEMGITSWNVGIKGYAKGCPPKGLTGMAAGTPDLMDDQASAFKETCNIWAPRYSQVGLLSLGKATPKMSDAQEAKFKAAMDKATADVVEAFNLFLSTRPDKSRPFVILGHSQGSIIATKVIKDVLAGHNQQKVFVAAYLAGGYIPVDLIPTIGHGIHVCTGPEDTNCIISWDTRTKDVWKPASIHDGGLALWPHILYWVYFDKYCGDMPKEKDPDSKPRVQISPLTWTDAAGGAYLGAKDHGNDTPQMPPDGWAEAVTPDKGGMCLWVNNPAPWMKDPGPAAKDGNLHPVDVTMWHYNLKENVAQRVAYHVANQPECKPDAPETEEPSDSA